MSDALPPDSSAAPPDRFRDALEAALTPSYALGRELGGGGMSRVFLAEERSLGRTVVVKVLPPDLAAGVNRDRFRREIQLAARLQHPHIVPLLAAGEVEGSLYYTMPYIEGESVRGALARGRRFGVRDMVRLLHDVVDALAYAHERGIIHRDVKPGNVLLQGAHALVTDFGVAKALSAARGGTDGGSSDPFVTVTGATSTGLAIGTPAYMAPEQLAADPSADHRVDLYATGLLAYELCTGASPFVSDSPRATLAAQLTRMPEPLDQLRPDVPPALSDVIMRCLAKEPADRPPTAVALLAELEAAVLGASLSNGERSAGVAGEGIEGATTPRSGATTPITAVGVGPDGVAFTAPANRPVLAHAAPTGAMPAPHQPQVERRAAPPPTGGERRHAWLVAGIVAGAGMALLAGVAFSRAREGTPVPPPASVAAVTPPPAPPTPAAPLPPVAAPAATPAPYQPPRLTREDSLAIAAAVERRLAAETRARRESENPPMAPQEVEAMRARAWQRYADSVRETVTRQFGPEFGRGIGEAAARAMTAAGSGVGAVPGAGAPGAPQGSHPTLPSGPSGQPRVFIGGPLGAVSASAAAAAAIAADPNVVRIAARVPPPRAGVRRVALLELGDGTGRPELRAVAPAVTEALRQMVAGLPESDQPDPAAAREASRIGLPLPGIAAATHAGAVVTGTIALRRDSLVQVSLIVFDAGRGYARSLRAQTRMESGAAAAEVAAALVAGLAESFPAALERVRWERRDVGPKP